MIGIVLEPARRASLDVSPKERRFSQRSKLYDKLLADMILPSHWARSSFPPGTNPSHKSLALPAFPSPPSSHASLPPRSEYISIFKGMLTKKIIKTLVKKMVEHPNDPPVCLVHSMSTTFSKELYWLICPMSRNKQNYLSVVFEVV